MSYTATRGAAQPSRGSRGAPTGRAGRGPSRGFPSRGKAADNTKSEDILLNIGYVDFQIEKVIGYSLHVRNSSSPDWLNLPNLGMTGRTTAFLGHRIREELDVQFGGAYFVWDESAIVWAVKDAKESEKTFEIEAANVTIQVRLKRHEQDLGLNTGAKRQAVLTMVLSNAASILLERMGGMVYKRGQSTKIFVMNPRQDTQQAELKTCIDTTLNPVSFIDKETAVKRWKNALEAISGPDKLLQLARSFRVSGEALVDGNAVLIQPSSVLFVASDLNLIDFISKKAPCLAGRGRGQARPGSEDQLMVSLRGFEDVLKGMAMQRDMSKYPNLDERQKSRLGSRGFFRGWSEKSANEFLFTHGTEEISVATYFEKLYGKLRFPNLKLVRFFTNGKETTLPPEMILVKAQVVNVFGNSLQQYATTLCKLVPGQVRNLAGEIGRALFKSEGSRELLVNWGISPSGQTFSLMKSPSHRCKDSVIRYNAGSAANASNNCWNMINVKVHDLFPRPSNSGKKVLAIDLATSSRAHFTRAVKTLCQSMSKAGVHMEPVDVAILNDDTWYTQLQRIKRLRGDDLRAELVTLVANGILAMLGAIPAIANKPWKDVLAGAVIAVDTLGSGVNEESYIPIKMYLEGKEGIPTQFIMKGKTPFLDDREHEPRTVDMFCSKLALGFNTKFTPGINHRVESDALALLGPKTLMIGGDLAHGKAQTRFDDKMESAFLSVACLTGSRPERFHHRFVHATTVQKKRESDCDIMDEPAAMFSQILDSLEGSALDEIDSVIYFRDGVDWGSHKTIMTDEVAAFEAELKKRGKQWKVSVLCLMKRHGVRMLPGHKSHVSQSVNASTALLNCVQKSSENKSFYLQAHAAVGLSCAVPCRVVVLRNEQDYSVSQWADLCSSVCNMVQTVTLGVSLPTPAYYAHRACDRAMGYVSKIPAPRGDFGISYYDKVVRQYMENSPEHCYL